MLCHENTPAYKLFLIWSCLAKHHTSALPHPPYSPDLARADLFLFPKLKSTLKGYHFKIIEKIEEHVVRELYTIRERTFLVGFQY